MDMSWDLRVFNGISWIFHGYFMDMSDMSWVFNEYLMCTTNYSQNQCRIKPLHSSCFALLECCSKLPPAHMNHGILHMASVWFLPSLPDHHRQPQHLIHPNRHGGTSAFTRMPLGCFSALALSDDPPSTYCPARVLRLAAGGATLCPAHKSASAAHYFN